MLNVIYSTLIGGRNGITFWKENIGQLSDLFTSLIDFRKFLLLHFHFSFSVEVCFPLRAKQIFFLSIFDINLFAEKHQ